MEPPEDGPPVANRSAGPGRPPRLPSRAVISQTCPEWPPGSVIYRGDAPNLRVLDVIVLVGREAFDVLVVEPVGGR